MTNAPSTIAPARMRGVLSVLGAVAVYFLGCWLMWWGIESPLAEIRAGGAQLDAYVLLAGAVGGWICLTWFTCSLVWAVLRLLASLAGRRPALLKPLDGRGGITPTQRLARLLVGTAVAIPLAAGPAMAQPGAGDLPTGAPVASTASETPSLADLPVLDRAAERLAQSATAPTSAPAAAVEAVVVRPGDNLWELAAEYLPDEADGADIAAAWPEWHAANADVIGADPDVLRPGQQLKAPPPG